MFCDGKTEFSAVITPVMILQKCFKYGDLVFKKHLFLLLILKKKKKKKP